jgi:hypothetical protein
MPVAGAGELQTHFTVSETWNVLCVQGASAGLPCGGFDPAIVPPQGWVVPVLGVPFEFRANGSEFAMTVIVLVPAGVA